VLPCVATCKRSSPMDCAANEPSGGGAEVMKGWTILSPKIMKPTPRTRETRFIVGWYWEGLQAASKYLYAGLIEPGIRNTLGPIVFTGKGPLFKRASSIRKSVSSIPVSLSVAIDRLLEGAW
jgi:hypothetical protein